MPWKIALVGKIGSGKTTLAEYLMKTHGFKRFAFADALKEICYKYFGMVTKNRELLQKVGHKLREVDEDVWVKILMAKIDYADYVHVVVEDCRYLNEAKALKTRGFTVIKLTGEHKQATPEQKQHESETQVDFITADYTLDTSKPLEETYKDLEEILNANT